MQSRPPSALISPSNESSYTQPPHDSRSFRTSTHSNAGTYPPPTDTPGTGHRRKPAAQRIGRAYSGSLRRVTPCEGAADAVQWSAPAPLVLPVAHDVHSAAPPVENVFAAHSYGAAEAGQAYPAGQGAHVPEPVRYSPASHTGAWHDADPASLTSVPEQGVQLVAPAAENVLAGQVSHVLVVVSAYSPSAHEVVSKVHDAEPAELMVPVAHVVHVDAPAAEKVLAEAGAAA